MSARFSKGVVDWIGVGDDRPAPLVQGIGLNAQDRKRARCQNLVYGFGSACCPVLEQCTGRSVLIRQALDAGLVDEKDDLYLRPPDTAV